MDELAASMLGKVIEHADLHALIGLVLGSIGAVAWLGNRRLAKLEELAKLVLDGQAALVKRVANQEALWVDSGVAHVDPTTDGPSRLALVRHRSGEPTDLEILRMRAEGKA